MIRNSLWLAWLALVVFTAGSAGAAPLLSEVFYDASGSDDGLGFVELWGTPGTSLDGLVIEGINGSGGAVTHTLLLSGVIPTDGFFVIADDRGDGVSDVTNVDLVLDFDFQNGYQTQAKSGGYAPTSYRNRARCVSPTCPMCHSVCYPGPAPRE